MKDICVENCDFLNITEWINSYTHKQKVEFDVYCAELVVDLSDETNSATKKAIRVTKDWILNPSEESENKCKSAWAAIYCHDINDTSYAAAYAAYAASYAANSVFHPPIAGHAAAYAIAAAYIAANADAADAAASASAAAAASAAEKSIKEKIVNYLLGKQKQPRMKEVYEKLTESNFDVWDLKELLVNGELFSKTSNGEYVLYSSARPVYMLNQFGMHGVYRKVEKPIEWWDDISEHVGNFSKTFSKVNMNEHGYLEVEASMSKEQWQDFARILLEQESE